MYMTDTAISYQDVIVQYRAYYKESVYCQPDKKVFYL
jgi:hypothetical protein